MGAANIVPHMLAPEEMKVQNPPQNNEYDVQNAMKSASLVTKNRSSPVEGDTQSTSVEPPCRRSNVEEGKSEGNQAPLEGEQLEKLYELTKLAEGTAEWTKEQQQRAKDVIKKYSFLFAMGTLDLGRTNLVKHNDRTQRLYPNKRQI